jgi:hypothetical protein
MLAEPRRKQKLSVNPRGSNQLRNDTVCLKFVKIYPEMTSQ